MTQTAPAVPAGVTVNPHAELTVRGRVMDLAPELANLQAMIRDIPGSCSCEWTWERDLGHWIRSQAADSCHWHTGSPQ